MNEKELEPLTITLDDLETNIEFPGAHGFRKVANYCTAMGEDSNGKPKKVKLGLDADEIFMQLDIALTGCDSLQRIGARLFVVEEGNITYLDNPSDLTGWCSAQRISFDWARNDTTQTKAEFISYLQRKVKRYEYASSLPHYPPIEDYYYLQEIEPEDNGTLDELLSQFNPHSQADRDLLKAAFCTPFWGGYFGSRPAFLIDGTEGDSMGNRGIGKTTITDAVAHLCGGQVDVSTKSNPDDIKRILLTAGDVRIVRMDNIKTTNLSSEGIESLITTENISGHRLYVGHGVIPNWFTYFLTFNDASLSRDMAQRCMIIRLDRPKHQAGWLEKMKAFISENRERIIANIGYVLNLEVGKVETTSRFATWEADVLARCTDNLKKVQEKMALDAETVDTESNIQTELGDYIHEKLMQFNCLKGLKTTVGIPRSKVTDWVLEYLKGRYPRSYASSVLARSLPLPFLKEPQKYLGIYYLIWRMDLYGDEKINTDFQPEGCLRLDFHENPLQPRKDEWVFRGK